MKRHSVYFEEADEEILVYDGANIRGSLLDYEERMHDFVLPSKSEFLLLHLYALSAFLDDIYAGLYERECLKKRYEGEDRFAFLNEEYDDEHEERIEARNAELDQLCLRLSRISDTVLRWHGDVMTREGEAMTGAYAVSYFSSWAAYTRTFHLLVGSKPDKLELYAYKTANEHAYAQMVSKRKNVVVDKERIIEYTIEDIWNSTRIITPTFYIYNYSPSMHVYINALFFRYADLLSSQQDADSVDKVFNNPLFYTSYEQGEDDMLSSIESEEGAEEEEDDDEIIGDTFDAFKKLSIKANDSYSIQNEFLYEGEALFYHQLYRMQISVDLIRYHQMQPKPITIRYDKTITRVAILKKGLTQWYEMCVDVSKDTFLKQQLAQLYSNLRPCMHLCHGDRERFKRQFPNAHNTPSSILMETHPVEMTAINNTAKKVLGDLLTVFVKEYTAAFNNLSSSADGTTAFEESVFENGNEEWAMASFEQEVLLLTKLSTSLYFSLKKVTEHRTMDDAFILEELTTLQSIEERLFLKRNNTKNTKKKTWPIFLKLMRIYYVMDTETDSVFKSLFFVEAYIVWLCLSLKKELISEVHIHPKFLVMVKILNARIQR